MLTAENHFLERFKDLDDSEILKILRTGVNYQPEAVEAAVSIAVERQLISKDEGEKLFGFTLDKIKQNEESISVEVNKMNARGRFEMVLGIIIFIVGLGFTVNSSHYIWIGALIVGPLLFIRGLFR